MLIIKDSFKVFSLFCSSSMDRDNGDGSVKASTKAGKQFYKDAGLGYVGTTNSGKWDKRGTSYKDVFE